MLLLLLLLLGAGTSSASAASAATAASITSSTSRIVGMVQQHAFAPAVAGSSNSRSAPFGCRTRIEAHPERGPCWTEAEAASEAVARDD